MAKKSTKTAPTRWSDFTKAELIKTITKLSTRETKLLNRIAELEQQSAPAPQRDEPAKRMPWDDALPNAFDEPAKRMRRGCIRIGHDTCYAACRGAKRCPMRSRSDDHGRS